jgi:hypothetical protein
VHVEAAHVKAWVQDLNSDDFAVRQKSTDELTKLGEAAEQQLRQALESQPPVETERSLRQLLDRLGNNSPHLLQQSRALELLERINTPEARQLLQKLATGAPEARLTREAKAALERLASRSSIAP